MQSNSSAFMSNSKQYRISKVYFESVRKMASFLDDITIDILLRLSVKSLARFWCICKSWKSLLNNAYFVKAHLNRHLILILRLVIPTDTISLVRAMESFVYPFITKMSPIFQIYLYGTHQSMSAWSFLNITVTYQDWLLLESILSVAILMISKWSP